MKIVSFDMISMSLLNEYNAGPGAPKNGALPLFMSEIDKDISSACLTTEGELGGFVAVSRTSQGLEISNVYVDQSCTLMLIALFKCSLDAAVETFPPETEVRVTAVNEESERLLRHIFKGLDMEESSVRTLYRAV